MSALSNKILSYGPEQHYTFDETYRLAPTNLGNGGTPANFTLTNEAPTYISSGGLFDEGYWTFSFGTAAGDTSTTRYRNISTSAAQLNTELTDNNFSTGFWFKANGTLLDSTAHATTHEMAFLGGANSGIRPGIYGGAANNGNKGKLYVAVVGGSTVFSTSRIDDDSWHYFAGIQTTDGTNNTVSIYLDGSLVDTQTYTRIGSTAQLAIGNTTLSPNPYEVTGFNISNFYIASPESIDGAAIAEIWAARPITAGVDVTIAETPAAASADSINVSVTSDANISEEGASATALLFDPTIATTIGDHVEITTSIPVSALMAPATVSTQKFINVIVDEPETAYSELINNIIVGGSNSVDFGAQEFFASAEIVEGIVSRAPLTATAESGNHTVYVDPSYYSLVKSKNPDMFYQFDSTSMVNDGSLSGITYAVAATISKNVASQGKLGLVGTGKSWQSTSEAQTSTQSIDIIPTNANNYIHNLFKSNNGVTIETWFKGLETDANGIAIGFGPVYFNGYFQQLTFEREGSFTPPLAQDVTFFSNNWNPINLDWNHLVLKWTLGVSLGLDNNNRPCQSASCQIWLNGSLIGSRTSSYIVDDIGITSNTYDQLEINFFGRGSNATFNYGKKTRIDQFAMYPYALNNSSIIDNYGFINDLDPNATVYAEDATANAASGSHVFTVTSNAIPEISVATASALAVEPTLIAGRSYTDLSDPFTASATIIQPEISTGNTISATPNIAYAESVNAFVLNSIYYDYVQANIQPYRYVTFDGANTLTDYGTDEDYSVQSTVLGGTVVNPDDGINGKSAKTAGTSYVTDGVILKESEWNDTWGTGQFNYHSSFWMQKAPEDNSTGLRVLWNLNGYLNNQHVILFQYQGKLHMQFNNGSGTHVDSVTTNNIDLFDGQRHFVVVAFDHTNNNDNKVLLYIDSVLVLTTSLGSYTGQTVNGTSFVGPNDEANNHPRLGVGCLITPFGVTALPVVPTNTRIYVDEIIWAKTAINQTGVTNLYNIMPDKNNSDYASDPFVASAIAVNPETTTSANYNGTAATATALINEVTVIADRNIVIVSEPMLANVTMPEPLRIDNILITSDIMVATAIFNAAGAVITVPGGPMLATISLIEQEWPKNILSPYMVHVIRNTRTRQIYSREVR